MSAFFYQMISYPLKIKIARCPEHKGSGVWINVLGDIQPFLPANKSSRCSPLIPTPTGRLIYGSLGPPVAPKRPKWSCQPPPNWLNSNWSLSSWTAFWSPRCTPVCCPTRPPKRQYFGRGYRSARSWWCSILEVCTGIGCRLGSIPSCFQWSTVRSDDNWIFAVKKHWPLRRSLPTSQHLECHFQRKLNYHPLLPEKMGMVHFFFGEPLRTLVFLYNASTQCIFLLRSLFCTNNPSFSDWKGEVCNKNTFVIFRGRSFEILFLRSFPYILWNYCQFSLEFPLQRQREGRTFFVRMTSVLLWSKDIFNGASMPFQNTSTANK